jgi:hypothetical protein
MTGLPGFDDYLDNHGSPGIAEDPTYPRWAIEERIYVTQLTENPDTYRINRKDGVGEFVISFGPVSTDPDKVDERRLLINGEDVELGDDFIAFISILDEHHEDDVPLGESVLQQPFVDEDADDADQ